MKIKVKQLEWYMKQTPEFLTEQGYKPIPECFPLIGRDGYYCHGDFVWFEFEGRGYQAYPSTPGRKAREYFTYDFTVNDEAILPRREADAIKQILKITRDRSVSKVLHQRLHLHNQALSLRNARRQIDQLMLTYIQH